MYYLKMFKTRIQSTENRIGEKEFIGPPELVPVHPLGDGVYKYMDESTTYSIKTEDGTEYNWSISVYVPFNRWDTDNVRNCVTRVKGDLITTWEEPPTMNHMVNRNQFSIGAQFKSDGTIIKHYKKYNGKEETFYYSPKNKCVNPIEGLQSVSYDFGESKTVEYPTPRYKMMNYQILAFQNQDLYTSKIVSADKVVDTYVEMCLRYVSPKYVPEEYTDFSATETYIKYHDRYSGDKPMMILITGIFTPDMISSIEDKLKNAYTNKIYEY